MPRSWNVSREAVRFGAAIRRLRLQQGMTRERLAHITGMNARHLGVLEQGGNDTSLSTIVKLCSALNADIGEVMREVAGTQAPAQ